MGANSIQKGCRSVAGGRGRVATDTTGTCAIWITHPGAGAIEQTNGAGSGADAGELVVGDGLLLLAVFLE
ncbi:MAG: hypothetical protein E1N59_2322 [Puniceicoccaceae bacterium 5H]|nr:MAG: hypothetical protein E1N59_2322 [Puniceicoccaceae bacterium 5H]